MKTLQSSYTVPGLFVLLLSVVLLSLASCGGGGGGGGGGTPAIAKPKPPIDAIAISAGEEHACAVLSTGAAKCWGLNGSGRLGDGSKADRDIPVAVSTLGSGVSAISAGSEHTCAIHKGVAKCWGFNIYGQLGDDSISDSNSPKNVADLGSGVTAISAGNSHTCAILSTGAAMCWGSNQNAQLGKGTDIPSSTTPVEVTNLGSGVEKISAGGSHTCAIHNTATASVSDPTPDPVLAAKCWGDDTEGQLGDGDTTTGGPTPVQVSGLGSGVIDISAGQNHTCAIHNTAAEGETEQLAAKCWGNDGNGRLGNGSGDSNANAPVAVSGELNSGVTDISAGYTHTCAVQDGKVWCWGDNSQGQLGREIAVTFLTANHRIPVAVAANDYMGDPLDDQLSGVTAISAGQFHTCALLDSGVVQCWGSNVQGQLGVGKDPIDDSTATPQTVREP